MTLTIGSLFSGIGGLELGLEWAGLGPVLWQVEIDPKARAVLAQHWPEVTRHEDVRSVGASTLAPVDLICGGFPCQDVSPAGRGAGLDGARSGLWFQFHRVVSELRPRWVVVENVAGAANRWVDAAIAGLGELGYACLPVPLEARDVGAPHIRARIFIVAAHADGESIRQQPGRRGRSNWPEAAESRAPTPDADEARRSRASGRHVQHRESSARSWWTSGPGVGPVVHGLSGGMAGRARRAKIRALGNAVVPQCAEVVGHVIRQLAGEVAA